MGNNNVDINWMEVKAVKYMMDNKLDYSHIEAFKAGWQACVSQIRHEDLLSELEQERRSNENSKL